MATIALTIAGVAQEIWWKSGLSITETANGRNTLAVSVVSLDASYRPALGAEVLMPYGVATTSSSVANPSVITTAEPHGLCTGDTVTIAGHSGSTPNINGSHVVTVTGANTFTIPVNVTVGGTGGTATHLIFGGNIDAPAEVAFGLGGGPGIVTNITAVDFNALADRRFVSGSILAGPLKAALQAVDDYLTPYSVTLDAAQVNGPNLPELTYDYARLTEVLDQFTKLTSNAYPWEITYNKILRMRQAASAAAPFNLAAGDGNVIGDIRVEAFQGDYANRIILRFSSGATRAYAFLGTTANFANNETVTIAGTTYTFKSPFVDAANNVAIGGSANASLDNLEAAITAGSGAGSAYGTGTTEHSQVSANRGWESTLKVMAKVAGASGNSIAIAETAANASWFGEGGGALSTLHLGADEALTNTVRSDDATEQGSQGLVERVVAYPTVYDYTVAQALSDALLVQAVASRTAKRVQYITDWAGVHPGQTQTITLPARNLSGTFIMTDVSWVVAKGNLLRRQVSAVTGAALLARWQDDAKALFSGSSTGAANAALVTIGGGGGGAIGTGTAGKLPKWLDAATLTDSLVSESGSAVRIGTDATVYSPGNVVTCGSNNYEVVGIVGTTVAGNINWYVNASAARVATIQGGRSGAAGGVLSFWTKPDSGGDVAKALQLEPTLAATFYGQANFSTHLMPTLNWTSDIGSQTLKIRTAHIAELNIDTLVAQDVISTIGGEIVTAPTTYLTADLAAGATTIQVNHNEIANGDRLWMEGGGQLEFMAVTSGPSGGAGAYTYSVTRNLDGSGANDWIKGAAVVNTGTTGDGFIHQYATGGLFGGTGPTIAGFARIGMAYNAIAARWAVGNLAGLYGYVGTFYGAAFGDPDAAHILIDPTNGIRIRHASTNKITLDASGNAAFTGSITSTSGTIGGWTINAGSLSSAGGNIALFSGASGSILCSDGVANWAALLVGDEATDVGLMVGGTTPASAPFRVLFSGALTATNATITGSITSTSGTIGGWTIGASSLTGGNATLASSGNLTLGTGNDVVRLSADDGTYRLWIGHATAGSAAFRVTKAGVLTASGASISGSVTSGGSLTAGGGNVTLDNDGVSIVAGSGTSNKVRWTGAEGGASVYGANSLGSPALFLNGSSGGVLMSNTSATLNFIGTDFGGGGVSLGTSTSKWTDLFVALGSDTGTAVVATAGDRIVKDSSSLRYKHNVRTWRPDPRLVFEAVPIQFDYIGGTKDVVGFSAEQLAEVAPELVNRDTEGRPDSIRTQTLFAFMLAAMKAQDDRLASLEVSVAAR